MKKIINAFIGIIIMAGLTGFVAVSTYPETASGTASGANTTYAPSLLPIETSKYYLGSTTPSKVWAGIHTDQLCLAGVCSTSFGTIDGGGGVNMSVYWVDSNTLSATSSPTFTSFTATSTTATSTVGNLNAWVGIDTPYIISNLIKITGNSTSTFAGGVDALGFKANSLEVTGDSILGGELSVTGGASIGDNLSVTGDIGSVSARVPNIYAGNVNGLDLIVNEMVEGDLIAEGDLYINGNGFSLGDGNSTSTISGTATSTWQGGATFAGGGVSSNALNITSDSLFGGKITVSGASTSTIPQLNVSTILTTPILEVTGIIKNSGTATSTFSGGINVSTTGGLSSATGLTITGGDIISSGRLKIDSTANSYLMGSVGIGTTNPLHTLSVNGVNVAYDTNDKMVGIYSTDSAGIDLGGSLSFGGSYTGTTQTAWADIAGRKENVTAGDYAGYLTLSTRPNGNSTQERIRITSSGNVGIGTTTPGAKLEVVSDLPTIKLSPATATNGAGLAINNTGGISYIFADDNAGTTSGLGAGTIYDMFMLSATGQALHLNAGAAGTGMTILPTSGNVGIGEVSPGAKLSVSGGGSFGSGYDTTAVADGNLIISGNVGIGTTAPAANIFGTSLVTDISSTNPPVLSLHRTTTAQEGSVGLSGAGLYIDVAGHATASNNFIQFRTDNTNSNYAALIDAMRITSAGNVGIGTTAPTSSLFVTGTSTVTSDSVVQGNISISKNASCADVSLAWASAITIDLAQGCSFTLSEMTSDATITFKNMRATKAQIIFDKGLKPVAGDFQAAWASSTQMYWSQAKSTTTPYNLQQGLNVFSIIATSTTSGVIVSISPNAQ